jgi:hypothetical protein
MTAVLEAVFENGVFNRNAPGRHGWLTRIRMDLIDYKGKLYLSSIDDEN